MPTGSREEALIEEGAAAGRLGRSFAPVDVRDRTTPRPSGIDRDHLRLSVGSRSPLNVVAGITRDGLAHGEAASSHHEPFDIPTGCHICCDQSTDARSDGTSRNANARFNSCPGVSDG